MNIQDLMPLDLTGLRKRLQNNDQTLLTEIPEPDVLLSPDEKAVFYVLAGTLVEAGKLRRWMLFQLNGNILFVSLLAKQAEYLSKNPPIWPGMIKECELMAKECEKVFREFDFTPEDFEGLPLEWPGNLKF